jgi:hypothetical protein
MNQWNSNARKCLEDEPQSLVECQAPYLGESRCIQGLSYLIQHSSSLFSFPLTLYIIRRPTISCFIYFCITNSCVHADVTDPWYGACNSAEVFIASATSPDALNPSNQFSRLPCHLECQGWQLLRKLLCGHVVVVTLRVIASLQELIFAVLQIVLNRRCLSLPLIAIRGRLLCPAR